MRKSNDCTSTALKCVADHLADGRTVEITNRNYDCYSIDFDGFIVYVRWDVHTKAIVVISVWENDESCRVVKKFDLADPDLMNTLTKWTDATLKTLRAG